MFTNITSPRFSPMATASNTKTSQRSGNEMDTLIQQGKKVGELKNQIKGTPDLIPRYDTLREAFLNTVGKLKTELPDELNELRIWIQFPNSKA